MKTDSSFKIGHCLVTPVEFSIQQTGCKKQSLQPKFIEVLCYLAEHHPRIIPRDELIDNIWGHNSYVGDKSLTNAIWHLRKNLTQTNNGEEVIETIRKSGYRLLLPPQWHITPTIDSDEKNTVSDDITKDSAPQNIETRSLFKTKNIFGLAKIKNKPLYTIVIIVLVIILGYFFNLKNTGELPKITQITTQPGSELFPAPSPDGRYLVYSQITNNQPTNLFMQDTWQPQLPAKQLTFDQATEGHSVWSNDGQYLYFSRKDKAQNICKYVQLNVSSQQEKELSDCPMIGGYFYLDISSDDKTLATYNNEPSLKKSGIYFIDLTKDLLTPLRFSCADDCNYKDRDMAFSPNGKYLAVTRRINRFSENIHLINLATKKSVQLTFDEEDIVGMTWHSDSQRIIYATLRADIRNGFVINIDNKTSQALNLNGFSYPSFARKSSQLYYQQRKESSYLSSLQLNNNIASSPFPVLQSQADYRSPDYSEKNDLVIYGSNESGFYELWSAKPNGTQRKQLTNLKQNIRYPKWSHDGKSVAFLAPLAEGQGDKIHIYSRIDEKVTLLKSPFIKHNRPSWSIDDKKIISAIYGDKHTDLYSININDATTERLTFDSGRYGVMASESTLLYTKLNRGLWLKDLSKNQDAKNVIDGNNFNTAYAWTYHDQHIYYHKEFTDHQQLIDFDLNTAIGTPLVRLPLNSFASSESLTYLLAQDSLLFTSTSFPQANIKMIEHSPLLK